MERSLPHNLLRRRTLIVLGLLLLNACSSNDPLSPVMPPEPPREKITSTILPPDPPPLPAPSLPKGITLVLNEENVTLDDLPALAPGAPARTVKVQAATTTPYRHVERVLDGLHERGYQVEFQAVPSP